MVTALPAAMGTYIRILGKDVVWDEEVRMSAKTFITVYTTTTTAQGGSCTRIGIEVESSRNQSNCYAAVVVVMNFIISYCCISNT